MIDLSVERWNATGAREQEAAARVVSDMLLAAGLPLEFSALQTGVPFTPHREAQAAQRTVAVFTDRTHGLEWVLVPGGQQAGWGERERKHLSRAVKAIEGWRTEDGDPLPPIESVRPYGAEEFEFSRMFRPSTDVKPFLTTAMPLLGTTRGLPALAAKRARLFGLTREAKVFTIHRDELPSILEPRGWTLPTASQSLWMTGGGQFIFPWGNDLPKWLCDGDVDEEVDEEEEPRDLFSESFRLDYDGAEADWSRANGFGLVDPLVVSHWVLDGERLSWAGGPAECYPWQACGEWAGFITAAIVPEPEKTDEWVSHALRPVIELASLTGR